MQSLKFNPFGTSRLSKRTIRQPSVSCAGRRNHIETRAALKDVRPLPSPKSIMTAAAGLSTVLLANPALADLDHSSVVNTAQQFGIAGVAMVTASAATYGGILLMQHMLKGFGGQQQQYRAPFNHENTSRQEGGNVPAFAFGGASGTPSSTTLSFREASFKPSASPAAVPAPVRTKPASKPEPSMKPSHKPEASSATTKSSSASHELLASMDTTSEPASAASPVAPHHDDSLFTAARGKSLQAIFRHGSGCSGHSRAAVDFVSNLLSPITEPASGSETARAASATQPQSLPQKATESISEFAAATEAAGDLLEAAEKESMAAEQQQAEYNARLKVIRQEANRKAAEEARRHQLRQRALDHMQPASAAPQEQPVPAAIVRKAQTPHGSQYLAGLATFLASLLAWLQAMWQRLIHTVTGQPGGRFAPSSA